MLAFLTSKLGAWVASIGAALVIIAGVLAKAFYSGKSAQQAQDNQADIQSQKEATDVQNEVASTAPDVRRDELRDWSTK